MTRLFSLNKQLVKSLLPLLSSVGKQQMDTLKNVYFSGGCLYVSNAHCAARMSLPAEMLELGDFILPFTMIKELAKHKTRLEHIPIYLDIEEKWAEFRGEHGMLRFDLPNENNLLHCMKRLFNEAIENSQKPVENNTLVVLAPSELSYISGILGYDEDIPRVRLHFQTDIYEPFLVVNVRFPFTDRAGILARINEE